MDNKLVLELKRELENNPNSFMELFSLLSEGVSDFINKNKVKQEKLAYNALTNLLYFSTSKIKQVKDPIPFILPAILYLFPNGYPDTNSGASISDKKAVDAFCQKWIELDYSYNYFQSKGYLNGKEMDLYIKSLIDDFKQKNK